ncbi:hypothetical protein ABEB36_013376 [Hypothenemus hampei]|uniref:Uncharacterized protein n=1 Tax=Hypothenemus hampei TaxID=57062 RepID=A0ABD1E7T7_HYPHA
MLDQMLNEWRRYQNFKKRRKIEMEAKFSCVIRDPAVPDSLSNAYIEIKRKNCNTKILDLKCRNSRYSRFLVRMKKVICENSPVTGKHRSEVII